MGSCDGRTCLPAFTSSERLFRLVEAAFLTLAGRRNSGPPFYFPPYMKNRQKNTQRHDEQHTHTHTHSSAVRCGAVRTRPDEIGSLFVCRPSVLQHASCTFLFLQHTALPANLRCCYTRNGGQPDQNVSPPPPSTSTSRTEHEPIKSLLLISKLLGGRSHSQQSHIARPISSERRLSILGREENAAAAALHPPHGL